MTSGIWRRGKCQHIVLASNADAYNAGMQVGAPPTCHSAGNDGHRLQSSTKISTRRAEDITMAVD